MALGTRYYDYDFTRLHPIRPLSVAPDTPVKRRIYIVDDEPKLGELFVTVLRRDGFQAEAFVSPIALLERIDRDEPPHVVLADLMMPDMTGIELLEAMRDRGLNVPFIIMTAHSSVQTAVEAMRLGAFHYLQKPVNLEEMRALLARALELHETKTELAEIKQTQKAAFPVEGILGTSEPVKAVRHTIEALRDIPNTTVLILGETGTGKNLVAKTIHFNSKNAAGRFMEINCAALPDNLLEAELFGSEKGAFTDARAAKPGLLEVADGGTVFLDEIDSMSIALQAKLLSFLEGRTFRRLGGVEDLHVNTRILCATNANLEERVANREFRKDLFFRINVVNLNLPSLRHMDRDVLAIARALVGSFNRELGREVAGLTPEAEQKLLEHPWPGNVRELRNVIERAMIFKRGRYIEPGDLVLTTVGGFEVRDDSGWMFLFPSNRTLEELERAYILHTLQNNENASYSDVSDLLGISKKTLWEKRKRYNLDEEVER